MPQLLLFNPGHEVEILCGKSHYTPPYTIQKMAFDLEMLPVWYGEKGNFVLVRNLRASQFISTLPKAFRTSLASPMIMSLMMKELYKRRKLGEKANLPPLTSFFWGISPRSISTFNELKHAGMDLEVPEWKDEYVTLTKRQTAAECLRLLQNVVPISPSVEIPKFFNDENALRSYVLEAEGRYLLKMPLSSSGRGLYWLKEKTFDTRVESWVTSVIKKQGEVSIEPVLEKVLDFAAEFYSDGEGEVRYEGLSIFETQELGQFTGCMLGSQELLQQRLNEFISYTDYMYLIDHIKLILKTLIGKSYTGYMGVDMMIYKTSEGNYAVHPCVEINLRYTMGLVAMQLSKQFLHPNSSGLFRIMYFIHDAQKEHTGMEASSPLVIEDGKIRSGYVSLCPVEHDTRYLAVMNVFG